MHAGGGTSHFIMITVKIAPASRASHWPTVIPLMKAHAASDVHIYMVPSSSLHACGIKISKFKSRTFTLHATGSQAYSFFIPDSNPESATVSVMSPAALACHSHDMYTAQVCMHETSFKPCWQHSLLSVDERTVAPNPVSLS